MPQTASKVKVSFTVNGKSCSHNVYPMTRLLDVLRDEGLLGTKEGCGEGECGTCSVFFNGELVNSCMIPIIQVQGAEIQTIEGIAQGEFLHKVQEAFLEHGGAQCGFCTPGMIMAAVNLLKNFPNPSQSQIRQWLSGNLCRCTGYTKIFDSVAMACQKSEGQQ